MLWEESGFVLSTMKKIKGNVQICLCVGAKAIHVTLLVIFHTMHYYKCGIQIYLSLTKFLIFKFTVYGI